MDRLQSSLFTFIVSVIGMYTGYRLAAVNLVSTSRSIESSDMISTHSLELVDHQGRRRALLGMSGESSPSLCFYDENGKARLNVGLHGDGGPAVVLNDAQENAVEILRTVGPNSLPVFVLKNDGKDRVILGLSERTREPYFVYFDEKGAAHQQFGHQ